MIYLKEDNFFEAKVIFKPLERVYTEDSYIDIYLVNKREEELIDYLHLNKRLLERWVEKMGLSIFELFLFLLVEAVLDCKYKYVYEWLNFKKLKVILYKDEKGKRVFEKCINIMNYYTIKDINYTIKFPINFFILHACKDNGVNLDLNRYIKYRRIRYLSKRGNEDDYVIIGEVKNVFEYYEVDLSTVLSEKENPFNKYDPIIVNLKGIYLDEYLKNKGKEYIGNGHNLENLRLYYKDNRVSKIEVL